MSIHYSLLGRNFLIHIVFKIKQIKLRLVCKYSLKLYISLSFQSPPQMHIRIEASLPLSMSRPTEKPMLLSQHLLMTLSTIGLRCVSKSWNSTITSPTFITTHLDRAKSLSSNNGYLVYMGGVDDRQLYTVVCNSDRTMILISGGSRKFFQGVQRSLQNLNITSLKKKKLHEIL